MPRPGPAKASGRSCGGFIHPKRGRLACSGKLFAPCLVFPWAVSSIVNWITALLHLTIEKKGHKAPIGHGGIGCGTAEPRNYPRHDSQNQNSDLSLSPPYIGPTQAS